MQTSALRPSARVARRIATLALGAFAVAAFVHAIAGVDIAQAMALLHQCGPLLVLALVPHACAMALDAEGLRTLLGAVTTSPSIRKLWVVRLATEAVHLSVPAGAVVADALLPFVVSRRGIASGPHAIAAIVSRKWLVMRAHGAFILTGAALGYGVLTSASLPVRGARLLPLAVVLSALIPLGLSEALGRAIRATRSKGRSVAARHFARNPESAKRGGGFRWPSFPHAGWAEADRGLGEIVTGDPTRRRMATLCFWGVWMVESIETWILLRLLSHDVAWGPVFATTAGLSLVRSVAFFAPSGLGVEDLGYLLLFRHLGVGSGDATSVAFLMLKRGKELVWTAIGYALLVGLQRTKQTHPAMAEAA